MTNNNGQKTITWQKTLVIAMEFGFIIVLPLVAFSYLGKWLEKKYDNRIFFMASLLAALIFSTIWLYRKIMKLYDEFTK